LLGEKSKAKPGAITGPPDEWEVIRIAEKFGVLPTTVERDLDEFWLNHIRVLAHGEALNEWRRDRERK
jgi:hypothetical protein